MAAAATRTDELERALWDAASGGDTAAVTRLVEAGAPVTPTGEVSVDLLGPGLSFLSDIEGTTTDLVHNAWS